jgi:uncharacterized protein YaaW (UPF0174 family)
MSTNKYQRGAFNNVQICGYTILVYDDNEFKNYLNGYNHSYTIMYYDEEAKLKKQY